MLKEEKGSITLFVLIAMIFFIIIATSGYIMASNKLQGQNEEVSDIKQSYEQGTSDEALDQLYKKMTANYQVQSTGDTFLTLAEAVENSATTDTIVQLCDVEDSSAVVIDGKNITFDNNGKTLTKKANGITVKAGAVLEVAGDGTITTNEVVLFLNSGTLNITHNGVISDTAVGTEKRPIDNYGVLNKTGVGAITNTNTYSTIGNIGTGAIATISAGVVSSKNAQSIHCYQGGTLNVQDEAQIITEANGCAIQIGAHSSGSSATFNMAGGKVVSSKASAIYMNTFSSTDIINVTITGGEIKGATLGIVNGEGERNNNNNNRRQRCELK